MHINYYQNRAREFALPSAYNGPYLFSGLAAEAGEACGKYAKFIRDSPSEYSIEGEEQYQKFVQDVKKEVGDILWFIALLGDFYGFTLEDIAKTNLDKLEARKNKGTIQGSGDNR